MSNWLQKKEKSSGKVQNDLSLRGKDLTSRWNALTNEVKVCLIKHQYDQTDPEGIDPEHCYETIYLPAVVSINLKRKTNS